MLKKLLFSALIFWTGTTFSQSEDNFYTYIPNANYDKNLTDYSVDNDFSTDDTSLVQQAIDEINNNGGGNLYIGPGNYTFEEIELKSNVHIVIDTLAVIRPVGAGNKNRAIFKFNSLDVNTTSGKLANVSVKSNDNTGKVIQPYKVKADGTYEFNNFATNPPSGVNITQKDYKRRFTVDLTHSANKNMMVFNLNSVDNFYLSGFHIVDNYTKFQGVGLGANQIGGKASGFLSNKLSSIDSKIDAIINNAMGLTSGSKTDILNSLSGVKTDVETQINIELSGELKNRALISLDNLIEKFATYLDQYNRILDNDDTNDSDISVSKNYLERQFTAANEKLNSTDTSVANKEDARQKKLARTNAGRMDLLIQYNGDHFKKRFKDVFVIYVHRSQPNVFYLPTNGVISNANTSFSHYGYGLIQAQSCKKVLFKDLSGDGGVTLRFETGFVGMNDLQIGGVDEVFGKNIYCQNGNSAAMVSPHSMHNGIVSFKNIVSNSCEFGIRLEKGFISNKYNRDVDGIEVGTYKKVTTDKVFAKFGFTGQIKQKHDIYMPSDFVNTALIPGDIYGENASTLYKFDRNTPVIAASTQDSGESVIGPSIAPVLQSIYYNCPGDLEVNNFQTTNIVTQGFNFVGDFLETGDALDGCPESLTNKEVVENKKKSCNIFPNPVINQKLNIFKCEAYNNLLIYDLIGNLIYTQHSFSDTIILPDVKKGVYILKLVGNNTSKTEKIIVL